MKYTLLLTVALVPILFGCASQGVSVKMPAAPAQPAPEAALARGKSDAWHPPVTVENMQGFDEEMFADLRKNFIEPLEHGPYRFAIESIRLAAVPNLTREWTLLMALDDGASIRVEDFVQWNEHEQSYFKDGFRRTLAGLDRAKKKDPALGRYVAQLTKRRKPLAAFLVPAEPEAELAPVASGPSSLD